MREIESMQDRILRAMHVGQSNRLSDDQQGSSMVQWTPTVDISEDDQEYLIKVEIPGVNKEDVHVTVDGGVLSLQGERRFENEEKSKKYHRIECCYGRFNRSLTMPDDADPDQVSAEFKDGLLRVHLVKSEAKKPKHIEVSVH